MIGLDSESQRMDWAGLTSHLEEDTPQSLGLQYILCVRLWCVIFRTVSLSLYDFGTPISRDKTTDPVGATISKACTYG